MDDWKELDFMDLPSSILDPNKWEVQILNKNNQEYEDICYSSIHSDQKYRYRKRAPKAPSHKEVVKKLIDDINEGAEPYNNTLIYDLKAAVLYLLVKSADISTGGSMSEWINLDVKNMPDDIEDQKKYKWQAYLGMKDKQWMDSKYHPSRIISEVSSTGCKYRYKKISQERNDD